MGCIIVIAGRRMGVGFAIADLGGGRGGERGRRNWLELWSAR